MIIITVHTWWIRGNKNVKVKYNLKRAMHMLKICLIFGLKNRIVTFEIVCY